MTKQPISNRLAFYGAWASVAIGSVVLAGWWMNIPSFRQLFLASGEVKANTGLLFILFGAAMLWQPEIPRVPGGSGRGSASDWVVRSPG